MTNVKLLYCNTFSPLKGYTACFPAMPNTRQTEFPMQDLGAGMAHLKHLKDGTKPTFSIKRH